VVDHPWAATFLIALGAFSFARFAVKSVLVFLQTFVLPGQSVRRT
jgi:17beta-estradiol 17-dehydrogenase / very-long-chain 3-oxoacyl-CoA reductase